MGAVVLGPDGLCESANPLAAVLLGTKIAHLLHSDFAELDWWRESGLSAAVARTMTAGIPFDVIAHVADAPKGELYLDCRLRRIDLEGSTGVLVTLEDTPHRESVERELGLTRLSIDKAADLIHWIAPDGSLLYASDSTCERQGCTRDELLTMTIFDLDPSMTAETWAEHWRVLQKEGTVTLETTHATRTGETFPVEVIANFVEHQGRQYNFAYARDISERRKMEESLRRTQFSIEKSADLIFWVDSVGRLIYVNEATCSGLGYSRTELLGMTVSQIDPEAPQPWDEHWERVKRLGALTFETVHKTKEGKVFPVEVSVDHHEFGGLEHHFVHSHDITERRRSEEALKLSDRLLREAQVVANLGSYVLDIPTGSWTSSEVLDSVFGIDHTYHRTVEGWLALVHPGDRAMMLDHLGNEVLGRGRVFDKQYRIVRFNDQVDRWVHGLGRLDFDDQGRPARMVGTIQDITERKQSEEALQDSEERLRQNQRLEAVGSLAGGIAHDFNNLLTAIIGQTEILRGAPHTSDEHHAGLEEIRTVADRAAALTRQLLAFSRLQALQVRVLNVNDVAESMGGLLKRVLGEDIDLVFREDPALWPVEADPGQLEQVLMNLAVNARDAMPQGGKLTVETANVELDEPDASARLGTQAGPYVLLTVSDTGHGMDAKTLSRVFEPFFTTKEQGKGTGLGLSTAYGIVKQSGGNIWVHSESGQGSTFKIYLPRAEKPIDWSPEEKQVSVGTAGRGSETVLVVEDEPTVRILTARILAGQGYQVLPAGSPDEAIGLFDTHLDRIDLILSDVVLPGMSGRAMVSLLLDKPGFAPKVLYMSGYARDALMHQGRLDEGIALLEKPFAPDDLLRKVREVLDAPVET